MYLLAWRLVLARTWYFLCHIIFLLHPDGTIVLGGTLEERSMHIADYQLTDLTKSSIHQSDLAGTSRRSDEEQSRYVS